MRVLAQAIFPAPYRVDVFRELGRSLALEVIFERDTDHAREHSWFSWQFDTFRGYVLPSEPQITLLRMLGSVLRRQFAAVIVSDYSTRTGLMTIAACKAGSTPYILNADGAFISHSPIKDRVKRWAIGGASALLASGRMAEEYFIHFGARKDRILRQPFTTLHASDILAVSPTHSERARARAGLQIGASRFVLTAGRLIPGKRVGLLIDEWRAMPPDVLLLIAGSGPLESALRRQVHEAALENVVFLGHLSRASLLAYMAAADVFAFPSESDTWGLVINEAMASGLPVVATRGCVAALELIHQGRTGYIVDIDDRVGFMSALRTLLGEPALRAAMSENALAAARTLTIENSAQIYQQAIQRAFDR